MIEFQITLYGEVDNAERRFWASCFRVQDDQMTWVGSTGTACHLVDAYADARRLLRRVLALPELEQAAPGEAAARQQAGDDGKPAHEAPALRLVHPTGQ